MLRDEKDLAFLLDMLLAARLLRRIASEKEFSDFEADEILQSAARYQELILGEAANQVSLEFRRAHREIPWDRLIGMRHRLVHGYREVEVRRVWRLIENDLGRITSALEALVPPDEESELG